MGDLYDKKYKTGSKKFIEKSKKLVDAYKEYQKLLSKGPFDNKINELMMLAASAAIHCSYCIDTHAKRAKVAGASEEEIAHVIQLAASVNHGATVSYGVNALGDK